MMISYTPNIAAASLSRFEHFVAALTRGLGFVALAITLLLAIAMLSQSVMAETASPHRSELVRLLGDRYAEAPVAAGLTDKGAMIEVLSTNDGSTWTIILTMPTGESRVLGAGEAWISVTSVADPEI